MNSDIEKLYQEIGESIYAVTPDEWDKISVYSRIIELDRSMSIGGVYLLRGEKYFINILDGNPEIDLVDLFFKLYHKMAQINDRVVPWNKCLFELDSDGEFDFKFKFDEDYCWSINLDIASEEYKKLDIDIIKKINSWEGLPKDFERFWVGE